MQKQFCWRPGENAVLRGTSKPAVIILEVAQKRPDTRRPKFRGVRRTYEYVATTRDEGNAVDGRFSDLQVANSKS